MFDIARTPVAATIAQMAALIDAVAAANQRALGAVASDVTPFHSRAVPKISVREYLERVARFVFLENDALLAVLVYLDRIAAAQPHRPALAPSPFNVHRLIITAIVIAHKFNSDIFFNNARYSKVGGIPLAEMNQLELEMLFLVRFDLKVDAAELQHVGAWLMSQPPAPDAAQPPPYSLLSQYHRQQQFPTPLLDPSTAAPHGAVPPLELPRHTPAQPLLDGACPGYELGRPQPAPRSPPRSSRSPESPGPSVLAQKRRRLRTDSACLPPADGALLPVNIGGGAEAD
ncbi:cyclin-like protein interacting with PHO85 [Coemansia javaensis]|uniref:Cyclin-like protein interacting with PHO85 n=1 Tax=Coemansia javaensis TaxID=2761396 RepID=A0A9W8HLB3_9FUNG|nr:cyclin-like protein interacting with PHO85 [Coemansia javaensis]